MGDDEEATTPAGRYLQQRMNDLGFKTKADLADTSGVSRSTITRLFKRPEYRPDVDVMRRLARGLQVEHDDLVAAIYGEHAAAGPAGLHPLAAELGRMLADDSPLSARSRAALAELVDRVADGSRREMRNPVAAAHRPDMRETGHVDVVRVEAHDEAKAAPEFLGPRLDPNEPLPGEVVEFMLTLRQLDPRLRAHALQTLAQFTVTLLVATAGAPPSAEEMQRISEQRPDRDQPGMMAIPRREQGSLHEGQAASRTRR